MIDLYASVSHRALMPLSIGLGLGSGGGASGPNVGPATLLVTPYLSGVVGQLTSSGMTGSITYSKVSGDANATVASNGAVSATAGINPYATNVLIVRATNGTDAIEHQVTLSATAAFLRATATGASLATGTQTISGGSTKARVRTKHIILEDTPFVQFVLPGFYVSSGGTQIETAVTWTADSVKLQLEVVGATPSLVRATVGGNDTPAPSGTTITLDAVHASAFGKTIFAKNDVIWLVQEYDFPAINGVLPITDSAGSASSGVSGERVYFGGTTSIGSGGSLSANGGTAQDTRMIRPWEVNGWHNQVAVALCGDSITFGKNVTNPVNDGSTSGGWGARACYATGKAHTKLAKGGDQASFWIVGSQAALRIAAMAKYTHAIVTLGTNDIAGSGDQSVTIRDNNRTLRGLMKAVNPSLKIWAGGIITRVSSSSDNYTTVAGQSPSSSYPNSERLAANALIAADLGLYDLNGVISFDSVTDDTGTPGKWVVTGSNNYATSDGTHPSQIMDGLMAGVAQPVVAAFTV